jgi:hypothetical protein
MPNDKAIIQKSRTERYEVEIEMYKGRPILSIRKFFLDKKTKKWTPTTKGLNIPGELSRGIFKGIKKVAKPYFHLYDEIEAKQQQETDLELVEASEKEEVKVKKKKTETSDEPKAKSKKLRPRLGDEDEDEPKPKKKKLKSK